MIAIRVQLRGPTNTKPARYHVTDGRHSIYVKYQYENDETERLAAAQKFRERYMPTAPELHPVPVEFKGDSFYHFVPKLNKDKMTRCAVDLCHRHDIPGTTNTLLALLDAIKLGATTDLT